MKKLVCMTVAMAMTASLFVACKDDGEDEKTPPPAPAITLKDGDIKETHEIESDMSVIVNVAVPAGISDFTIRIDSPCLTPEELGSLGLAAEMNLVSPATTLMAIGLKGLGFPVSNDVKDKTALSFDISKLIPLIAAIYDKSSDHNFTLTVTDSKNQSTTETLKFHLTGSSNVAYNNDADLWANTASFKVKLGNEASEVKFEYKRSTASDWQQATVVANADGTYTASIAPKWVAAADHAAGAKQVTLDNAAGIFAGGKYEYRVLADGVEVEGLSGSLDAPAGPKITGGDMESWEQSYAYLSQASIDALELTAADLKEASVYYPNASKEAFWANGNNLLTKTLCQPDTLANNTYAAKLQGMNAFITFAAGNLYTGVFEFIGVPTASDYLSGYARFGQKYPFTARPSALKVRYKAKITNYTFISGLKEDLSKDLVGKELDKARIFVCITDWSERHSVMSGMGAMAEGGAAKINAFDPETQASTAEGKVLAYGSKWIDASTTGDDWVELVIPILYKTDTKDTKPGADNYSLVISAAGSAYGDYLSGSWDNELYLDNFEWVY